MRILLAVLLLSAALRVVAAELPNNLQPVPEPPPPLPGMALDPALEPQVTIIQRGTDTVEEYRVAGKLYMLKVTPANGRSYYLIDEKRRWPHDAPGQPGQRHPAAHVGHT